MHRFMSWFMTGGLLASVFTCHHAAADVDAVAVKTLRSVVQVHATGGEKEAFVVAAPEQLGNGTVLTDDGLIVATAAPAGAAYEVVLRDGTRIPAEVKVRDHRTNLVLLKAATNSQLAPITFSDHVAQPDEVVVLAHLDPAVRRIVADGRIEGFTFLPKRPAMYLQAKVLTQMGSAGAPVVDAQGHLLGIAVAFETVNQRVTPKSFAIPARYIRQLLAYRGDGPIDIWPGFMGAQLGDFNEAAEVVSIREGSPAQQAEIQAGDRIVDIDGHGATPLTRDVMKVLRTMKAGDLIRLTLDRNGTVVEVEVALSRLTSDS